MFDIGWTELVVIGVVALIVIGPKDLPEMFKTLGRFTAKARSMARDFQRAMEAAADDAGVKDVAKDLKTIASPQSMGLNAVKDAATKFEKWDPLKTARPAPSAKPAVPLPPVPMPPAPVPSVSSPEPALPSAALSGPLGPATQALADAQAAKRAALTEAPAVAAVPAVAKVAPPSRPAVAAPSLAVPPVPAEAKKADAAPARKAKVPVPAPEKGKRAADEAEKKTRKPRARKTDA
jgi:sec-independent protein translocase protein TatB